MSSRHLILFGVAVAFAVATLIMLGLDLFNDTFRPTVFANALFIATGISWVLWYLRKQAEAASAQLAQVTERFARVQRVEQAERTIRRLRIVDSDR